MSNQSNNEMISIDNDALDLSNLDFVEKLAT